MDKIPTIGQYVEVRKKAIPFRMRSWKGHQARVMLIDHEYGDIRVYVRFARMVYLWARLQDIEPW